MCGKNKWVNALFNHIRSDYNAKTAYKGSHYAAICRVSKLGIDENKNLTASVDGSRPSPYKTTLRLVDDWIETRCSCPVRIDCKHAYAVALTALYGAWISGLDIGKRGASRFPMAWRGKKSGPPLSLLKQISALWEETKPDAKNGGKKEPIEPWWRVFLETYDKKKRNVIIENALIERFLDFKRYWYDWQTRKYITKLLDKSNPFDVLHAYESTVQEIGGRLFLRIRPPDPRLKDFLNSDEAKLIETNRERQEGLQTFLEWLETTEKDRPAESVHRVEIRWASKKDSSNIPLISFQTLLTTARMTQKPRSSQAIRQLADDIKRGFKRFSVRDESLLKWISQRSEIDAETYYSLSHRSDADNLDYLFPIKNVLEWINVWGDSGILQWKNGGDVRFETRPAKLSLSRSGDDALDWIVRFPSEIPDDAIKIPLRDADCLREGSDSRNPEKDNRLFVRKGDVLFRLETGGMDARLVFGLRNMGSVPFDRLRGSIAGTRLVERLQLSQEPSLRDFAVQYAPVRPVVEISLRDPSGVFVVCHAVAPEGRAFSRQPHGTWALCSLIKDNPKKKPEALEELSDSSDPENQERQEASPANPATPIQALAILPRTEDVKPLDEWLDRLVPQYADGDIDHRGFYSAEWKLSRRDLPDLFNLWKERPPRVDWLGNRAFKNLVTPRLIPRWNVKIEPSGVNWLSVSIEMEKEANAITMEDIEKILKQENEELIFLPGKGTYRREDVLKMKQDMSVLNDIGLAPASGTQRLHVLQLGGEPGQNLMALGDREDRFRDLAANARKLLSTFKGAPARTLDKKTGKLLRPYQRYGVDFISWACQTFGGVILADDMGLGKTFQVLAALNALRSEEKKPPPSLVVCPASVTHNWIREAALFAPNLKLGLIERGASRKQIYQRMDDYDLLITNYSLARRDKEILAGKKWFLLCVDEAQSIKNPHAAISQMVKELEGRYRVALTGTPIENRLLDLWSIVEFIVPGFLPGLSTFEQKWRESENHSFYRLLRARLRPLLLRRLKSEVAPELPPRIEERRDCEMTTKQKKAYLAELQKTRLLLRSAKTDRIIGKERIQILAALTKLRQICCDPEIIGLKNLGSGKTALLVELVMEILESGHKTLVFSQFVRMLNRLKSELKTCGAPLYTLTGKTRKRKELIERFENDPNPGVFLISLKAGGLGLNLISASRVILFDPWWNPAVEAQAIDRTHRIGQDKTVLAFRLVTLGTIEERILELQEKKRELVKNVLEEEAFNRTLTREDLAFLLE